MIKKFLSILLSFILMLTIVFSNSFPSKAQINDNKGTKEYQTKQVIHDGDLVITLEKNSNDDIKITVLNSKTNYTITNYAERIDGNINITSVIKDAGNKINKKDYTMNEKAIMKNNSQIIPSVVIPPDDGDPYYWYDNLRFVASGWNSDIGDGVPYTHVDYNYYQIYSYQTDYIDGSIYRNLQISASTSNAFNGLTGGVLGAAIGAVVGSYLKAGIPTDIIVSAIGAVIGTIFGLQVNNLTDERGCIWVSYDINPTVSSYTYEDIDGRFRTFYDYHFRAVTVGPYWHTNLTITI